MQFGYARVSTMEQNEARQVEALKAEGIDERNIFVDKVSGAKSSRPALDDLLSRLRQGDAVVVLSFDRLARTTRQLLSLSEELEAKGVDLVSLHEKIDTSTPQGKLFFTVCAAFSEFERSVIKERQAEGIALAKAKRGRCGGRPKVNPDSMDAAIALYKEGKKPVSEISRVTGVSRSSLYRELSAQGISRTSV